jgi:hypothetical protein
MGIEAMVDFRARHVGVASAEVCVGDLDRFRLPLESQSGSFKNGGGELRSHDSEIAIVLDV